MQADRALIETADPAPALSAAALQTALAHPTPGAFMLANMPLEEFNQHLKTLKLARERVQIIQKELMEPGVHYGKVPGVEKPFLHQPGAELLAQMLHLVPEYIGTVEWGDGINEPAVTIITECRLHYGTLDGPVVGTGRGACTSWERKYRYRKADRTCPDCGRVGAVRKSKEEYGGGWYCAANSGGCGAKFKKGDDRIEKQELGMVLNPDQADLLQTVLAMGDKRSYVKSVRTTTATSDLFTQDDDLVAGEDESVQTAPGVGRNAGQQGAQGAKPAAGGAAAGPAPNGQAGGSGGTQGQQGKKQARVYSFAETWEMTAAAVKGLDTTVEQPLLSPEQVNQIETRGSQQGWGSDMVRTTVQQQLGYRSLAEVPAGPDNLVFRRLYYIFGTFKADQHFSPPEPEAEAGPDLQGLPGTVTVIGNDPFAELEGGAPASGPTPATAAGPAAAAPAGVPGETGSLFAPTGAPLQAENAVDALAQIKALLPQKKGKPITAAQLREIRGLAQESGWSPDDLDRMLEQHLGLPLSQVPWTVQREMTWFVCNFPGPDAPEVDDEGAFYEQEQDIPA